MAHVSYSKLRDNLAAYMDEVCICHRIIGMTFPKEDSISRRCSVIVSPKSRMS